MYIRLIYVLYFALQCLHVLDASAAQQYWNLFYLQQRTYWTVTYWMTSSTMYSLPHLSSSLSGYLSACLSICILPVSVYMSFSVSLSLDLCLSSHTVRYLLFLVRCLFVALTAASPVSHICSHMSYVNNSLVFMSVIQPSNQSVSLSVWVISPGDVPLGNSSR